MLALQARRKDNLEAFLFQWHADKSSFWRRDFSSWLSKPSRTFWKGSTEAKVSIEVDVAKAGTVRTDVIASSAAKAWLRSISFYSQLSCTVDEVSEKHSSKYIWVFWRACMRFLYLGWLITWGYRAKILQNWIFIENKDKNWKDRDRENKSIICRKRDS